MTKRETETQWTRYLALAETDARTTPRFQDAGTYANWVEAPETTDEAWAEAFWNAYLSVEAKGIDR
jgi:hypothetical protein